jgi:hypothetical protein
MPCSIKREKVYDQDKVWVDTKAVKISGFHDDEELLIHAYIHKIAMQNNERTSQDANDNQNGSFEKQNGSNEKQNTYTEIVKTTHQNKVSKRIIRRFKPPYFVSKRLRMKLPYIVSKRQRIRRRTKHAFKEVH